MRRRSARGRGLRWFDMRVALGEVVGELLAFDVDIGKGSTERRGQLPCTVSEQDEDQDGDAEQPDRALGARRRGRTLSRIGRMRHRIPMWITGLTSSVQDEDVC